MRLERISHHLRRRLRDLNDLPVAEQAQRLGISIYQVQRMRSTLIKARLLPSRHRLVRDDDPNRVRRLLAQGLRKADVATRIGVSEHRITRIISLHGITVPEVERWTVEQLSAMMLVSDDLIRSWIDRGWLLTKDAADERPVKRRHRVITRENLRLFLHEQDAWPSYEPRVFQDDDLRNLGQALRLHADGRWLGRIELASWAGISANRLGDRLAEGWLAEWRWVTFGKSRFVWVPRGVLPPPFVGPRRVARDQARAMAAQAR